MSPVKSHRKVNSDNESLQMCIEVGDDHEKLQFGTKPIGELDIFDPNSAFNLLNNLSYIGPSDFWVQSDRRDYEELSKI